MRDQSIESERPQRREPQRHLAGDVAERVAPLVPVGRRVGQFADADAVHDDDEGSGEVRRHEQVVRYWCEK